MIEHSAQANKLALSIFIFFGIFLIPFNVYPVSLDETVEYNGHRYFLSAVTGTTWLQAREIAANEMVILEDGTLLKGHLVTINDQAEQNFIANTFMTLWWRKLWLGGFQYSTADEPAGYWAWLTGEEMGNVFTEWSYQFMDSGQPGNDPAWLNNDENVLRMLINKGSGGPPGTGQDRWNDFSFEDGAGDNTGRFVIEFDRIGDNFVCLRIPPKIRILSGSNWKSSSSFSEGWESIEFDDSEWNSARSPYPQPVTPSSLIPGTNAQHMWHDPSANSEGTNGVNSAFFRYHFNYINTPGGAAPTAIATISVDDDYSLYVNGFLVFENHDGGYADVVDSVDFSSYIQNGKNVIAIHAVDGSWNNPGNRIYERVIFDGVVESSLLGDFNTDCCVDRGDMQTLLKEVRSPTPYDTSFDLNDDGSVNIADVRFIATLFSQPRGAACD